MTAGVSAGELNFILKMQDQASGILRVLGRSFSDTGRQIDDAMGGATEGVDDLTEASKRAGSEGAAALKTLSGAAVEFMKSIGLAFTAQHTFREQIEEFRTYESAVERATRTTQLSGQGLTDFEGKIDGVSRALKGVGTENLLEFSAVAGQLGVRGADDVSKFAETVAKLSSVTDIAGHEGAQQLGRLLLLTGEGAQNAGRFSDVLVGLVGNTKASAGEILTMTSAVAQSTAGFKLAAASVAGYGAAAAQLNQEPMLFASVFGRTLLALRDGALNATAGMRTLTSSLGMSREEFKLLIDTDPAAAFEKFLSVLKTMKDGDVSPSGFLAEMGLSGEEANRVLGTMVQNYGMVVSKRKEAEELSKTGGATDRAVASLQQTLDPQLKGLTESWGRLTRDMGAALAPVVKIALQALTGLVDILQRGFAALPNIGQSFVAWGAIVVPAIMAVRTAWAALQAVFAIPAIGVALSGLAPYFAAFLAIAEGVVAGVVAAFSLPGLAIAAVVAAVVAAGVLIYQNWDAVTRKLSDFAAFTGIKAVWDGIKAYLGQAWDYILTLFEPGELVQALGGAFDAAWENVTRSFGRMGAYLKQAWQATKDIFTAPWSDAASTPWPTWGKTEDDSVVKAREALKKVREEARQTREENDKAHGKDDKHGYDTPANQNRLIFNLSPVNKQAISALDTIANVREQIVAADNALQSLEENSRKVTITGDPLKDGDARSGQEIARLKALQEIRRRALDPVVETVRLMGLELQSVAAVTAEEKNRVEVTTKVREETEKVGLLLDGQKAAIENATRALQQQRTLNAANDDLRTTTAQLNIARQLGQAAQARMEVEQRLSDFVRTQGDPGAAALNAMRAALTALNQQQAFNGVRDQVDQVGAATRRYAEDVATIEAQYKAGNLTLQERDRLLRGLANSTLAQRDPLGSVTKGLQDQIELLKVGGDYQTADKQTLQTILDLRSKNVVVTREQEDALREVNRAMADLQKSKSSGLEGWSDGIGTIRDNLLDLQKDFASGLSSAISGALQGNKDSFTSFLKQIGGRMIDMGVNQILKQGFEAAGGKNLFGLGGDDAAKRASDAAEKLKAMTAQTVTVQAGAVYVNGTQVAGTMPGSAAPTFVPGNASFLGETGRGTFGLGGITGVAGQANGVQAAMELLRRKEGFQAKAYWDVNHWRAGYGSDTFTRPDGTVGTVNQGTIVDRAGAEADLSRRVQAQQNAIRQQLGNGAFDQYAPGAQGALTSVAYNYGKLPTRVLAAVRSGDTERAASAVESLKGDNSGVNAARRQEEADLIRSSRQQVQIAQQTQQQLQAAQQAGGQGQVQAVQQATGTITASTQSGMTAFQQAAQTGQTSFTDLGNTVQQAGQQAAQAAPGFQQAGQAAGQAGSSSALAAPQSVDFSAAVGQVSTAASGAVPGLGAFSGIIGQLAKGLAGGIGSGESPGFGEIGKIGTAVAGLFHSGGEVGSGGGSRVVNPAVFEFASRYHQGGVKGLAGDEYPAILQRGERVLTEDQKDRTEALLRGAGEVQRGAGGYAANQNSAPAGTSIANQFSFEVNMQGSSGDPQKDQAHVDQTTKQMSDMLDRKLASWVNDQMRPGGQLHQSGARRARG